MPRSRPRLKKINEPKPYAPPSTTHDDTSYRQLANALPQIIWTCDARGQLEWVNDRWYELTGLTEHETLYDKGALVAVHPDDLAELARRWGVALETGSPTEIEYRVRDRTGAYRWHLGRVAPVRDASGTISRWVAGVFDIHDRRAIEDELRASERRFETIFQFNPEPISITRLSDGMFLHVNDAFLRLAECTREEVIGKTSVSVGLWTANQRMKVTESLRAGLDRMSDLELQYRTRSGKELVVMVIVARIQIDGEACLLNLATDVTDRRSNEATLRHSETLARARADELAALMDAVPAGVWISEDPACRRVTGNRAGHALLRMNLGDNLSKTADDPSPTQHFKVFVNGAEVPVNDLPLQRASRGEEFRNYEEEIRFADGQVAHLYGSVVPLREPNGEPRGAIGAFVDVTRLKQTEAALRQADRRKDEFVALLSHELRNPLTPILTAARLLERRGDPEAKHDLDVIIRQVRYLVRLVDDLLDISRVARGMVNLVKQHLELASVVAKAVEATEPLMETRRHRLTVSIPSEGLTVDADEVRLIQVISNLLTNAARYTPPGGEIHVSASREGTEVVLRVGDSGVGIDAELLPDVFEMFVRGSREPDRAQGGLGLGLALVRTLTELHGGSVTARSDGAGRGSEFTVRLPALVDTVPRTARVSPAHDWVRRAQASKGLVLIVDDMPDVAEGLARLLTLGGYETMTAHDPLTALTLAQSARPSIAILDIGLPVMDGYALGRALHAQLSDAPPLLIALTGYSQTQDRERSAAAGFAAHLVKPVDAAQLVEVVDGLIAGPRRHGRQPTADAAYA